VIILLASSAADAIAYDQRLTLKDTRETAREWIAANVPPEAAVTKEFYTPLTGSGRSVQRYFGLYEARYEDIVCSSNVVVASSASYARYFVPADPYPERRQFYERLFRLPLAQEFSPSPGMTGPTIKILTVPAEACLDTFFLVSWDASQAPSSLSRGSKPSVRLAITNDGTVSWAPTGARPIRLSYHWRSGACPGGRVEVWDGLRTNLTGNVAPGSTVELEAHVDTPTKAGTYCLQFDLVREGVAWFSTRGGTMSSTTIRVE
jgi:hypothetical protein